MQVFTQSEAIAARRRFHLFLVDAIDGITAKTGEAAGQPQVSKNGGAWANTTNTLTAIGNGSYYVELTTTELDTLGTVHVRYKSAATAEFSDAAPVIAANLFSTPQVNVTQWSGTAVATPNTAGVPRVDVDRWRNDVAPTLPSNGHIPVDVKYWSASQVSPLTPTYGVEEAQAAQGGGASTITLHVAASSVTDFYKGTTVHVYSGAGAGQSRFITAYDGTTKVATVDSAWATQPNNTSLFVIAHRRGAGTISANVTQWNGTAVPAPNTAGVPLVDVDRWRGTQPVAYSNTRGTAGTALPDAAAETLGGLFTRGTGVGQINQDTNGRINANVTGWLGAGPNVLQSGRVDSYLGATGINVINPSTFTVGAIDARALNDDAVTEIQSGIASGVWAHTIESVGVTNYSAAQLYRLLVAILAGDGSDLDGPNPLFKSLDGTKTRISGVTSTDVRNATLGDLS